jgi:hypothetical protein
MRSTSNTDYSNRAKYLCHRVSAHTRQLISLGWFTRTHTRLDTAEIVRHSICALKVFFDVGGELRIHSLTKSCITLVEINDVVH